MFKRSIAGKRLFLFFSRVDEFAALLQLLKALMVFLIRALNDNTAMQKNPQKNKTKQQQWLMAFYITGDSFEGRQWMNMRIVSVV